jgi:hypothetical protein
MQLTHLISVIGILIFPGFSIHAAEADSSTTLDTQRELLSVVASTKAAKPYGEVLEALKISADVYVPKDSAAYRAMRHAFWAEYASGVLKMFPLEVGEDDTPVFLNVLAMLRGEGLPPSEVLILGDELQLHLLVSIPMFEVAMRALFPAQALLAPVEGAVEAAVQAQEPVAEDPEAPVIASGEEEGDESNDSLSGGEEDVTPSEVFAVSESVLKSRVWFSKVLSSQFFAPQSSKDAVKSRLIQASTFLLSAFSTGAPEPKTKARLISMIQSCILNNADDCPDRALSGLDDFEVEMQLFKSDSIEHIINVLLRLYKKQLIQDYLVSHEFAESAEEYAYLVLLLNDSLNLGAVNLGLLFAPCGARKTYDVALYGIISNLSLDGVVQYVARNVYMQRFLSKQAEHTDVFEAALVSGDVEEALFSATKNIVAPLLKEMFTIKGHPYTAFDPATLEEIASFL